MEIYLRRHDLILAPTRFLEYFKQDRTLFDLGQITSQQSVEENPPCIQTYDAAKRRGLYDLPINQTGQP